MSCAKRLKMGSFVKGAKTAWWVPALCITSGSGLFIDDIKTVCLHSI